MDLQQMEAFLAKLGQDYRIFAPKRFIGQGRFSDTDIIRYAEVGTLSEMELHERSTYSAKEVVTPINQTLFYFTPEEYRESKPVSNKPILVFLRACDIHAFMHQDKIYLENGQPDLYYQRIREKLHFVLIECASSFDTCFCVSMGCNQVQDYSMAVRLKGEEVLLEIKEPVLADYIDYSEPSDFTPSFVMENPSSVTIPDIADKDVLLALKKHSMWSAFDKRCISCGSCTLACSTCTCFTTRDRAFTENADVGERRRVTASCQVPGFDDMAGGHSFRITAGDRMRYKMLHKFHDYKARFGEEHMCVGCGRCTSHCPEYISMTSNIEKMNEAIAEIIAQNGGK